jgi:hypothetical protein
MFKLATELIITGLLFRQAASEDEYKREYSYLTVKLHVYNERL